MTKKFYAYFLENEKVTGIVETWDECKNLVHGKKARYKSFSTRIECENWLETGANYEKKAGIKKEIQQNLPIGIYFDAGTGRGIGVETRITDEKGNSLTHFNSYGYPSNEFGNVYLGKEKTNNFGELLGLLLAIDIATKGNYKHIYGDSNLVLFFWSKGIFKKDTLPCETIELILKVIEARKKFELSGGSIEYISGDYNPADLGFHK
ncbi:Predicted double-stranded RNA/RNA-DNA hybrid binding protein [Fusobacterium necrogenes]|uniref:Ribonuclease H n=1 Tax=Fusobacterium necrogenes TaxID=858 RepID=A0A377GYB1_9FUSO|nr:ribonuclease H family protein [Fusobacterium necrogenes]STO31915.1 Predicted double-stranded RNA/RNA-DNA hybrid binding protein [Fusobacterium necrogenes]